MNESDEVAALRSKANAGDAGGQFSLGNAYFSGQGVPQDDVEAAAWYLKAAEQGDAVAQTTLGFMYDNGLGVPQDDVQAVSWYRRAAEQGLFRGGRLS